jgi:hypothetical protein
VTLNRRDFLRWSGFAGAGALIGRVPGLSDTPASGATISAQPAAATFFERGWALDSGTYDVPEWFTGSRVHGSTRLGLNWASRAEFARAAEGFRSLGAKVMMRHVKTGGEDPWWQAQGPNVVKQAIDSAHEQGLHFIAYYWHISDTALARKHPEWACVNSGGKPILHSRGPYMDLSSAYREEVLTRLLELAAMGADGFNFDETHMPLWGCWAPALSAGFRAETGKAPPRQDNSNPNYLLFLDYQTFKIEETFAYWRRRVRERYPNVLFIISSTVVPSLLDRRMTTNLVRIADASKNEFRKALAPETNSDVFRGGAVAKPDDDTRMALGWTVLRDAADGRPPRIWAGDFATTDEWLSFASAVMTHGAIANVNVNETAILRESNPRRAAYKAVFGLGNRVSPYFAGTLPVRWAAVHWSELSRNARGSDYSKMWVDVLWPVVGAYGNLLRAGVPVGVINDAQLSAGRLDGYKVLVLTTPDELTSLQRDAVDRFQRTGGTVIRRVPEWRWDVAALQRRTDTAFRDAVSPHMGTAPVVASAKTGRMHAVAFRNATGRTSVAVSNSFGWVRLARATAKGAVSKSPPPVRDIVIDFRGSNATRATDAVSGDELHVERLATGLRVHLPQLSRFSVVVPG